MLYGWKEKACSLNHFFSYYSAPPGYRSASPGKSSWMLICKQSRLNYGKLTRKNKAVIENLAKKREIGKMNYIKLTTSV